MGKTREPHNSSEIKHEIFLQSMGWGQPKNPTYFFFLSLRRLSFPPKNKVGFHQYFFFYFRNFIVSFPTQIFFQDRAKKKNISKPPQRSTNGVGLESTFFFFNT